MKLLACKCEKCGESMTATRLGRKSITATDLRRIKALATFHLRTRHGMTAKEAQDFADNVMLFYIPGAKL